MSAELPPIFAECCDQHARRYDLSKPFVRTGRIYATDGRILILYTGSPIELPDEPGRKVPLVESLPDEAANVARSPFPLPECDGPIACIWCKGTGVNATGGLHCDDCGEFFAITRHGKPVEIDCHRCDGIGHTIRTDPILIRESPPYYLQANYVHLLRKHGVTEVMVPNVIPKMGKAGNGEAIETCTFTGDGFEGWLMPMDSERAAMDLERRRS